MFRLWPFLLNFKDPASVYAFSLMYVHHQVMWYMILILAVVYWSFYRIIREYNWHMFNRRQGIVFVWIFEELRRFPLDEYLTPFWLRGTALWLTLFERLSAQLLHSWLRKERGFFGYQGWGRLATTLVTLQHGHRFPRSAASRSSVLEEVLREKYMTFSSRGRYHWNLAYFYSSTTTPAKEVLASQRFRENLMLEYVWATFPSLVIFLILVPSLYLLYSLEERVDPKLHVRAIGHQWFWTYQCDSMDLDVSFQFDSILVPEGDLSEGAKRLLEVDRRLLLPLNLPLRILVTSSDVLHSWAVPELGIKIDAVPGRLNDAITLIRRPGTFYGQCSELCGVGHGFMPIAVESLGYHRWLEAVRSLE